MRTALFSGILFLSGCSALLFETLWLRLSGLAFGNSVWSTALILSSFMAGMALGNTLAALGRIPKIRPLHLYILLEILVAITGCTLVFGIPDVGAAFRPLFSGLWDHQAAANFLRFAISFCILLIPTTALGLTLPALLGDTSLKDESFARSIGYLYGSNTLGAVLGALLGELYLIQAFGLRGTAFAAAGLSLSAAGIAFAVAIATRRTTDAPKKNVSHQPPIRAFRPALRLLIAGFGSGCLLLGLEVIWFRFLRLYIASSATAFATMLACVLAGIGSGGIVAGVIHRHLTRQNILLPGLFLLAALGTLISYLLFPVPAPHVISDAFYIESLPTIIGLSAALMFPVSFLSGMLFPSLVAAVQTHVGDRLNATGAATLFNTVGAATGPLLASFLLLPRIGFQSVLILCACGYLLLALLTSTRRTWSLRNPSGIVLVALSGCSLLLFVLFPYNRDELHFANARRPYERDGARLVRKLEGTADTYQLLQTNLYGQPYYNRLLTDGFSMSSTQPRSQRYMRLFAYLPLALRPQSQNALLICYGVGVTANALTRIKQLQRIAIVDISPEVFRLAHDYRTEGSADPLKDSRVRTVVQDGRFFLQVTPRKYDIITGEPPPLKVAGTVNLYTREFFQLIRKQLKPGGIASFWLPIYQLRVNEAKSILKAFHEAFPNASVWGGSDDEWIMLGINGPGQKIDPAALERLFTNAHTGPDLRRIGIESPEQFGSLFLMDGSDIERITSGIKPLTDLYPKRLSDRAPNNSATAGFAWPFVEASKAYSRFLTSSLIERIWPSSMKYNLQTDFGIRQNRFIANIQGDNWLAELDAYLRKTHLHVPVLDVLNTNETRVRLARNAASAGKTVTDAMRADLLAGALADRDYTKAIRLLNTEKRSGFKNANNLFLLIYLNCVTGDLTAAESLATGTTPTIRKDALAQWLWKKMAQNYGFKPPR